MKIFRILSVIAASSLMLTPLTAFAYEQQKSNFPQFDKNEVNGRVVINVPESLTADVSITFSSPEGVDFPYYSGNLAGGKEYAFDIEGRDNTADDYRIYTMNVTLTNENGTVSALFADTFNNGENGAFLVKDVNDNPDSFIEYRYDFSCDDRSGNASWELSDTTETGKSVIFHMTDYALGDVNGNRIIDSVDASAVLLAYALSSVNQPDGLSEAQRKAADVNTDSRIDSVDASTILAFYAETSVGKTFTLEEFVKMRKN